MSAASSSVPHPGDGGSLRERNKRRRVERILEASLALMREDPESPPTVERIAARAEVSPMTVFNLVGTRHDLWRACVRHALTGLDPESIDDPDPRQRARAILAAVVRALSADEDVFRALLHDWRGDPLPGCDPTSALVRCFADARTQGTVGAIDAQLYGEVVATGLLGAISQWTSRLLSATALGARAQAIVDIAFLAARADDAR